MNETIKWLNKIGECIPQDYSVVDDDGNIKSTEQVLRELKEICDPCGNCQEFDCYGCEFSACKSPKIGI